MWTHGQHSKAEVSRRRQRRVAVVLLLALAAGCLSVPRRPPVPPVSIAVPTAQRSLPPADVTSTSSLPVLIGFTNAATWVPDGDGGPVDGPRIVMSPEIRSGQPWTELIVSWNVQPAEDAGLTVEAQALRPGGATRFYAMGQWSLEGSRPVARTSVPGSHDAEGTVKTDTLVLAASATGVRLRLSLYGELRTHPERLRLLTLSLCDRGEVLPPRPARSEVWGRLLEVPERSQIAYPGGESWCSPTCVSMMLGWWAQTGARREWDRDVPEVAAGVHDPAWPGTGNWPFNTAYAGSLPGLLACAARLRDLRAVEDLVDAGIPVVLSVYSPSLRGRALAPEGGHLVICVGFTPEGDVIINDPWARLNQGQRVRRVYPRANVQRAWDHAHRLAYLIAPESRRDVLPVEWH